MKSKSKMFLWIGSRLKGQRGFTLIELMIALVIAGLVVASATAAIYQIFHGSTQSSNHNTAVRQVQNAGLWLSKDVEMAENITRKGPDGFPLELIRTEFNGNLMYTVIYGFEDSNLWRYYTDNNTPPNTTNTTIAEHITQASCAVSGYEISGYLVTCNITAEVGTDIRGASESREYEIRQRPHSTY